MKKYTSFLLIIVVLSLFACKNENTGADKNKASNGLTLVQEDNAAWKHGNLQLFPIVADEALVAAHASQSNIKTLSEAMDIKGFRIIEQKQFGREQGNWYNGLTLVNKSADTVYMMSGDVVTGGNQDRVNEENLMAMPGTIQNFPVFCVEHGRSYYYDNTASESEKRLAAFKGYYSVASPKVRKAVHGGDQSEVWGAVASVTQANNAQSSTSTYAALESADEVNNRCKEYINFFGDKFGTMPNAVGLIAVSDGHVIGVEIFGHPNLFQRRVKALVHGYAVEAAQTETTTATPTANLAAATSAFYQVAGKGRAGAKSDASAGRFDFGGEWLHLYLAQ